IYDYNISYSDIKALFKESTPFNTIFLSEYQDKHTKMYDLHTGIGPKYYGMLFDGIKVSKKLSVIGHIPYTLAYLARNVGLQYCISNYSKLQIVMPAWGAKKLANSAVFKKFAQQYYQNMLLKTRKGDRYVYESTN